MQKSDPFGVAFEVPPLSASVVKDIGLPVNDDGWMTARQRGAWIERPMSIYEVHLSRGRVPEEGDRS